MPNIIDTFAYQNFTLALISDDTVLQYPQLPPPIAERMSTSTSLVLSKLTLEQTLTWFPDNETKLERRVTTTQSSSPTSSGT
jgi:hypothetical protein